MEADLTSSLQQLYSCLLYTSDAADEACCVDLGGRRIIKKNNEKINFSNLLVEITKRTLNENKFESNLFFL